MAEELEERVRKLEIRFAFAAGAAVVLAVSILGLFGVTNWYSVPKAVEAKVDEIVGQEIIERVRAADQEAQSLLANSARLAVDRQALNHWVSYDLNPKLCALRSGAELDLSTMTCYSGGSWFGVPPPFPSEDGRERASGG